MHALVRSNSLDDTGLLLKSLAGETFILYGPPGWGSICRGLNVMLVNPFFPARTLPEFIANAKAHS